MGAADIDMHRFGNRNIFAFELGLASQVEEEPTAKSEDERANQSESWDGQKNPADQE